MTSTEELEAKNKGVRGFVGVFGADQLDLLMQKMLAMDNDPANIQRQLAKPASRTGYSAIVNYSAMSDPRGGTHWVGFGNMRGSGPALYFDSFGFAPDHDDVLLSVGTSFRDFLRKVSANGQVLSNPYDLQSVQGDECGEYASFFIKAGSLPRLQPYTDQPRFAAPWDKFQYVRIIDKSRNPSRRLLAGFAKDDDAAKRNDLAVRQWAGIINPALHNGGPQSRGTRLSVGL